MLVSQLWFQLLAVGVTGAAVGAWLHWGVTKLDRKTRTVAPVPKRTLLRLQFYGDLRFPTALEEENVYSWFAYRREQMKVKMQDKNGKTIETLVLSPSWYIFLVLEVEHDYRSVDLTYRSSEAVQSQVRQTTRRSIVVVIEQDMPAEQFEIRTVSANRIE